MDEMRVGKFDLLNSMEFGEFCGCRISSLCVIFL